MREFRLHGFGRGAVSNDRPYRASRRVFRILTHSGHIEIKTDRNRPRREALRLNYGSPFVTVKGLNPRSARAAHEAAPRCGNRK